MWNPIDPNPMELRYALSILGLATLTVNGQDIITLHDGGGNVVNGTTVRYYGTADASVEEVALHATLVSGQREINVRRYELTVDANTQNYFCWGICYGPQDAGAIPVWNSLPIHSLQMQAGVEVSNFKAYHVPMGVQGVSTYRYVWYDVAMPTDSVWADIEFHSGTVGMAELARSVNLNVFPNPTADLIILQAKSMLEQSLKVELADANGRVVLSKDFPQGSTICHLETETLYNGVYFLVVTDGIGRKTFKVVLER
mgnify:CR=1 FL=1